MQSWRVSCDRQNRSIVAAGADAEIMLDVPGHSQEFDAFEWVRLEDVKDRVVGFKQDVYAQVAQEFAPIIEKEMSSKSAQH